MGTFSKKQVVCVRLREAIGKQWVWKLGIVLDVITENRAGTLYKVSIPSEGGFRRSGPYVMYLSGTESECDTIVLPDNPLALLCWRLMSRTFLDRFRRGEVLKNRDVHLVGKSYVYPPDPKVLYSETSS